MTVLAAAHILALLDVLEKLCLTLPLPTPPFPGPDHPGSAEIDMASLAEHFDRLAPEHRQLVGPAFATICTLLDQTRQIHHEAHQATQRISAALRPLVEAFLASQLGTE